MKERNKGSRKMRWIRKPLQKLTDELTGGPVYNDNVEKDYKGFITTKGYADPKPQPEYRVNIPSGVKPWIIRKETNPQDVAGINNPEWDSYDEYWNTSELEWGD